MMRTERRVLPKEGMGLQYSLDYKVFYLPYDQEYDAINTFVWHMHTQEFAQSST